MSNIPPSLPPFDPGIPPLPPNDPRNLALILDTQMQNVSILLHELSQAMASNIPQDPEKLLDLFLKLSDQFRQVSSGLNQLNTPAISSYVQAAQQILQKATDALNALAFPTLGNVPDLKQGIEDLANLIGPSDKEGSLLAQLDQINMYFNPPK